MSVVNETQNIVAQWPASGAEKQRLKCIHQILTRYSIIYLLSPVLSSN